MKQMLRSASVLSGLVLLVLQGGCDFRDVLPLPKFQKQEVADEERKDRAERKALREIGDDELMGLRESTKAYISSEIATLEAEIKEKKSACEACEGDRAELSRRIAALTKTNELARTHAQIVSALLGDEKINALARKYLNTDFSLIRLAFDDEYGMLLEKHNQKKTELDKSQIAYEETKAKAEVSVKDAKKSSVRAMATIREEIRELEKKAARLEREIAQTPGTTAARRVLNEKKSALARLMQRLQPLRTQYEAYAAEMKVASERTKESDRQERTLRDARSAYEHRRERLNREYKDLEDLELITRRYEEKTLDVLNRAFVHCKEQNQKYEKEAGKVVTYAKGLLPSIDKLGVAALNDFRRELESRINRLNGVPQKKGR